MIPVELGDANPGRYAPLFNLTLLEGLDTLVVENARTARQYIRKLFPDKDIASMQIFEIDKHRGYRYPKAEVLNILKEEGRDVGFMSEAGCPGVADPGARVVEDCHKAGITVVPLVGPSSILLGLMASGFSGQNFRFRGYLPFDKEQRKQAFKEIASRAEKQAETQIFIEAPYRNDSLLSELALALPGNLSICMCIDLTTDREEIIRLKVSEWRTRLADKQLTFHKRPAIFLVGL